MSMKCHVINVQHLPGSPPLLSVFYVTFARGGEEPDLRLVAFCVVLRLCAELLATTYCSLL